MVNMNDKHLIMNTFKELTEIAYMQKEKNRLISQFKTGLDRFKADPCLIAGVRSTKTTKLIQILSFSIFHPLNQSWPFGEPLF